MTTDTPPPPRPVMDDEHRRDERKGWSKARDLTGLCFGKLVVVKRVANNGRNSAWLCKCLCGDGKVVRAYSLLSGDTTSCGCKRARHVNGTNLITDEHRLNAATASTPNSVAGSRRWNVGWAGSGRRWATPFFTSSQVAPFIPSVGTTARITTNIVTSATAIAPRLMPSAATSRLRRRGCCGNGRMRTGRRIQMLGRYAVVLHPLGITYLPASAPTSPPPPPATARRLR